MRSNHCMPWLKASVHAALSPSVSTSSPCLCLCASCFCKLLAHHAGPVWLLRQNFKANVYGRLSVDGARAVLSSYMQADKVCDQERVQEELHVGLCFSLVCLAIAVSWLLPAIPPHSTAQPEALVGPFLITHFSASMQLLRQP